MFWPYPWYWSLGWPLPLLANQSRINDIIMELDVVAQTVRGIVVALSQERDLSCRYVCRPREAAVKLRDKDSVRVFVEENIVNWWAFPKPK